MKQNGHDRPQVIAQGVSLLNHHWAMVDANAKDKGLISRSASLRVMLDRLAELEARENGVRLREG